MEKILKSFESKAESFPLNKKIRRYPFNGTSKYLFDKFLLLGYDGLTREKEIYPKLSELIQKQPKYDKKESNEIGSFIQGTKIPYNPLVKPNSFEIPVEPNLLGEICSDYTKDLLTNDKIIELVFPNKYYGYYYQNMELYTKARNESLTPIKQMVVFHSNPNTNEGLKRSQYGYAHIFYERVEIKDSKIVVLLPKVLCIISEFPYYTAYEALLEKILQLLSKEVVKIPVEIILYNLICFTPSPLNTSVSLNMDSFLKNPYQETMIMRNVSPKKKTKINEKSKSELYFPILTGIPIMQINLQNLLRYFTPQMFFKLFIFSFLEKDILFFSSNLEMISMTIFALSNLNFPFNDGNYYWFNASVSYQAYVTGNSVFVGNTNTTMLGIHSPYSKDYLSHTQLKDHFICDLDNKEFEYITNKVSDDVKPTSNVLSFIKKIVKDRTLKNNTIYGIFRKLYTKLEKEEKDNPHNSGYPNFYDKVDMNVNKRIQEYFYTFIAEITTCVYKNISFHSELDTGTNMNDRNRANQSFYNEYNKDNENQLIQEEKDFYYLLRSTFKFSSFVEGFVKTSCDSGLYQIPFTFIDEFSNLYGKQEGVNQVQENKGDEIKYLDIIESIYTESKIKAKTLQLFKEPERSTTIGFTQLKIQNYDDGKIPCIKVDFSPFFDHYFEGHLSKLVSREVIDQKGIVNRGIIHFSEEKRDQNLQKISNNFEKPLYQYDQIVLNNTLLMRYIKWIQDWPLGGMKVAFPFYPALLSNELVEINRNSIEAIVEEEYIRKGKVPLWYFLTYSIFNVFSLTRGLCLDKELVDQVVLFSGIMDSNLCCSRKYFKELLFVFEHLSHSTNTELKNFIGFSVYFVINKLRSKEIVSNEPLKDLINILNRLDNNAVPFPDGDEEIKYELNATYNARKDGLIKEDVLFKIAAEKAKESGVITNLKTIESCDEPCRNTVSTPNEKVSKYPKLRLIIRGKNIITLETLYIYTPKKIFDDLSILRDKIIYDINTPGFKPFDLIHYCINLIFYIQYSPESMFDEDKKNSIITLLVKIVTIIHRENKGVTPKETPTAK